MSKKKRKNQRSQSQPIQNPIDQARQQEAVKRLATLLRYASAPPEPLLAMFVRLGIPYKTVENVPGDKKFNTIVILESDLKAGEARNQAQGSVLHRLYGKEQQVPVVVAKDTSKLNYNLETFGEEEPIATYSNDDLNEAYLKGMQG